MINNSPLLNFNLDGEWNYVKDHDSALDYDQVMEKVNHKKKLNSCLVPSNWETQGLHNFDGTVWFIRKFVADIEALPNTLHFLQFDGVDYFSEVFLNDTLLGSHEGYFQQFKFPVKSAIRQGENVLVVKVTSPREEPGSVWPLRKKLIKGIFNHHDCRPGGWDYKTGQDRNTGGIWNSVALIAERETFISHIKVTSTLNRSFDKAAVLIEADIYSNKSGAFQFTFDAVSEHEEKTTDGLNIRLKQDMNSIKHTLKIHHPRLWYTWDLGNPERYTIAIKLENGEEKSVVFGIREVHLDGNDTFFLNGKRLFLRGTNVIPEQMLSTLTPERIKTQVDLIREAHINIIRMHAHVNRPEYYQETDRKGILVWQDFALQWTYDESEAFQKNAVRQIGEMVRQRINHPSIAFWCCHNEPGEQIETLDHKLRDAVLREDSSRIIRTASNYEEHPYDGWYWGKKEHYAAAPMGPLVTEFGAQGLPALKSLKKFFNKKEIFPPDWAKWRYHNFQYIQTFQIAGIKKGKNIKEFIENSQNYQAELIQEAIAFYRRKRFNGITGVFQFMFIDCWESITWSVVDYFGVPKKGYFALQQAFKPLSLDLFVRQLRYFAGQKLLFDYRIINDLHQEFKDVQLFIYVKKKEIYNEKIALIKSDSLLFTYFEKINAVLPDTLKRGKHKITARLINADGKELDSNIFTIEIEKKPESLVL